MVQLFSICLLLLLSLQRSSALLYSELENVSSYADDFALVPTDKRKGYTYLISGGQREWEHQQLARFMVSIRTQSPTRFFGDNHFCAGSIIGPKAVLTAAHCVMDKRKVMTRARRVRIVAGTPDRLLRVGSTAEMEVSSMISHPKYVRDNTDDIAIIRLKRSFPVDNVNIAIIPLPNEPPPYGHECTIIGWGRMYHRGPLSDATLHVSVPLIKSTECEIKGIVVKNDTFCAGDETLYDKDPCRGDSGGPLICHGELTGIISWTIGCGSNIYPSLYTDVYNHLDWIIMHLNAGPSYMKSSILGRHIIIFVAFFVISIHYFAYRKVTMM